MSGSQRDLLKQSLKDRPEKTRVGAVIFTNISPSELIDPHHPHQHADGLLTISANNSSVPVRTNCACRRIICLEIIANGEHPNPELFRTFYMEVFCFPDPDSAQQVISGISGLTFPENLDRL